MALHLDVKGLNKEKILPAPPYCLNSIRKQTFSVTCLSRYNLYQKWALNELHNCTGEIIYFYGVILHVCLVKAMEK